MSCNGNSGGLERYPGTGCCGTNCAAETSGCSAAEPRIRSCFCQENVGCLDRADCGGFRPRGTAATGACPGPCQCAEEEAWNRNVPPKPNCEWLSNFSELRRQWSDHGRQMNCKCCNCEPCRTAAPCKPCLPAEPKCSTIVLTPANCQKMPDCWNERLAGGACGNASRGDCGAGSQCSLGNSPGCRPPSSCQPCSPSPRPNLKKRSCCQCMPGHCMCQPMPRTCHCPPPVQVDARADRECSCECPSSPECACPPSERKFARAKIKCPNARLCCSTPRPPPGPKCLCAACQPCLPAPCDPCTSSKCRTVPPKVPPCRPEVVQAVCRPVNADCSQDLPFCRPLSRPCSPGIRCSSCRSDRDYNDGDGDREEQYHCGPTDIRGCAEVYDRFCSRNCEEDETRNDDPIPDDRGNRDEPQCNCGESAETGKKGCHEDCDHCCSLNCWEGGENMVEENDDSRGTKKDHDSKKKKLDMKKRNSDGGKKFLQRKPDRENQARISAGGNPRSDDFLPNRFSPISRSTPLRLSVSPANNFVGQFSGTVGQAQKDRPVRVVEGALLENSRFCPLNENIQFNYSPSPKTVPLPAVAENSRSTCKLLRFLNRAKSSKSREK